MSGESVTVDSVDRAIVRGLQIVPRGSFALISAVLDTSEQTVARRYRRLHRLGVVRVTAVLNVGTLGQSTWGVRIGCRPSGTNALARALASRDDIGWVSIAAGGAEVMAVIRARTEQVRDDLLLQQLPRSAPVLGITVSMVMHSFVGHRADDWAGLADALSDGQERQLRQAAPRAMAARSSQPYVMDDVDQRILDALVADGRVSYAALAKITGISQGMVTRRLDWLLDHHVMHLDLDLAGAPFGFTLQATLWLTVSPAHLDSAGRALALLPEVAFVAAVSGARNMLAEVMCQDTAALYQLVSDRVGAITGITGVEVVPILRVVKQAGTLMTDGRLAP